VIVPKPHILSIHPTMQCDYHCHGCYLKRDEVDDRKERNILFFQELIGVAKRIGMTEVAIPANYTEEKIDKNFIFYNFLKLATKLAGMEFTCTANYDFVMRYVDSCSNLLDDVSLMSVSINDYSTSTPDKKREALQMLQKIKSKVPTVNCNVLVTPSMVKTLSSGLMKEILDRVDTVYLLVEKPLIVPMDTVKGWLTGLEQFFDMIDDRVILDSCLKSAFGLTDGICSKHQLIYVNPYGDVKKCSYDGATIFTLQTPDDLEILYNEKYPQQQLFDCRLLHYAKEEKK